MKKFLSLMLVLMMLMSLSSVSSYASDDDSDMRSSSSSSSDDDSDDDNDDKDEWDDSGMDSDDDVQEKANHNSVRSNKATISGSGTGMGAGKATFKEFTVTKKTDKEALKAQKEAMKEEIEANREAAKANREMYRNENSDDLDDLKSSLTDDQKIALEALRDTHKAEMDALQAKLKTATNQEAREAIYAEMKALAQSHYEAVAKILGTNASSLVEKRKAVWEENEELRDNNRMMRSEYRDVKRTTVEKYRKAFATKLGNSLDKIPAEKLPQIVERINKMLEKEGNSETMTAALVALLELVEEKMEGDDVESDVLDVVESLLQ